MQLAGNFGNFPKVNITQKSALLDPRMLDYAPSTGWTRRCNSDFATLDAVPSPQRQKRPCNYKVNGEVNTTVSEPIKVNTYKLNTSSFRAHANDLHE